jgi:hypothetical protein
MLKVKDRTSNGFMFNRYARLQADVNGPTRDCLIVQLSDDMVRLHSDIAETLGDFTLTVPEAIRPRRSCRVVWRIGYEVGAKFTDQERDTLRALRVRSAA